MTAIAPAARRRPPSGNDRHMVDMRLVRLRRLIAELERAPISIQRDTLLREARSRVVSIETGSLYAPAWSRSAEEPSAHAHHALL